MLQCHGNQALESWCVGVLKTVHSCRIGGKDELHGCGYVEVRRAAQGNLSA